MTEDKNIRYAFCPYLPNKCYQKPVIAAGSTQSHLLATTQEFVKNDYCAWKIVPSDTDLAFSRYLNITVQLVLDVNCAIYHGDTIDSMMTNTPIDCTKKGNKTTYDDTKIPASHHVTIVVTGKSYQSFIAIEYELGEYIDTTTLQVSVGIVICCLICAVNFFILFVLQKTTRVQFSKVENTFKEHGIYMSIEMTKSEAAFEEFEKLPKEVTDPAMTEESPQATKAKERKRNKVTVEPPDNNNTNHSNVTNENSQIGLLDRKAQAEQNAINQQNQAQMMQ